MLANDNNNKKYILIIIFSHILKTVQYYKIMSAPEIRRVRVQWKYMITCEKM